MSVKSGRDSESVVGATSTPIHLGLGGHRSEPLLKGITGNLGRVSGAHTGRGACALCPVLRLLAELMGGGASMGALVRPNTD